eukprot:TRINITY_DN35229_c0_g1_i1.p1 TRINITY_DN35229_c0_g1~~TRINITY_DN35229_c0_g1_i1.p1  ORF type:complete len:375 (+),score=106.65 TRINITY_DN35229_c0_g1_i1:42-1127(+)
MALDTVEKAALRNTAVVGVGFAVLNFLKKKGRKGKSTREWDETIRSAAAAGLTAEVFGRLKGVIGEKGAGIASLAPLKLLADDDKYMFNYKFVVTYLLSQALLTILPQWAKKYPILINSVSAAQLLSTWIMYEDRLPLTYKNFLHSQGKATREHIVKLRETYNTGTYKDIQEMVFPQLVRSSYAQKHGTSFKQLNIAAFDYFINHWQEAFPFYVKIYSLRLFAHFLRRVGATGLASIFSADPIPALSLQLSGLLFDIMRSSTFLTLYCTSAWWMLGQTGNLFPDAKCSYVGLWFSMFVPGLALAIESPAQQVTISNYCTTFALYPLLCRVDHGFDAAGVAMALLCSSGTARRPALLNMLWP